MAPTPEVTTEARRIIARGDDLLRYLPTGPAGLLFENVALVQRGEADMLVGLYLACHGAQIQLLVDRMPRWSEKTIVPILEAMQQLLCHEKSEAVSYSGVLRLEVLRLVNQHNFKRSEGFTITKIEKRGVWTRRINKGTTIAILDGSSSLQCEPNAVLLPLYECLPTCAQVEIIGRPGEQCSGQEMDAIRACSVALGFGVRHSRVSLASDMDEGETGLRIGLVRLNEPMTEIPFEGRENDYVLGNCYARLDIASQICSEAVVLDAGGGSAIGGRRYLQAGATHVTSLEVSAHAIEVARECSRSQIESGQMDIVHWDLNITPLPLEDASFDVVVCLEVLEHIREQQTAIDEFMRVLKPGGVLLISVPQEDFEKTWTTIHQYENPFHRGTPSRAQFEGMLERFELDRWLVQADFVGSLVVEEQREKPLTGEYVGDAGLIRQEPMSQVIMAVCRKPLGKATDKDTIARVNIPEHLQSVLRLKERFERSLIHAHLAHDAASKAVRTTRFEWWSRVNDIIEKERAQIDSLTVNLASTKEALQCAQAQCAEDGHTVRAIKERATHLEGELQQSLETRALLDQQIEEQRSEAAVLRDRLAQTHDHAKRAQGEQKEIIAKLEQERATSSVLNDRVVRLTEELQQSKAQSTHAQQSRNELESRLAAEVATRTSQESAMKMLREKVKQSQFHHDAQMNELSRVRQDQALAITKHNEERHFAKQQYESVLIEVERKCLEFESRVYDLEDERLKDESHNGVATTPKGDDNANALDCSKSTNRGAS